jgi:hypothetical protein
MHHPQFAVRIAKQGKGILHPLEFVNFPARLEGIEPVKSP